MQCGFFSPGQLREVERRHHPGHVLGARRAGGRNAAASRAALTSNPQHHLDSTASRRRSAVRRRIENSASFSEQAKGSTAFPSVCYASGLKASTILRSKSDGSLGSGSGEERSTASSIDRSKATLPLLVTISTCTTSPPGICTMRTLASSPGATPGGRAQFRLILSLICALGKGLADGDVRARQSDQEDQGFLRESGEDDPGGLARAQSTHEGGGCGGGDGNGVHPQARGDGFGRDRRSQWTLMLAFTAVGG